ncbi:helix-turn-helix domain-containing protein [Ligilactobacillus apodemi]|nr:helix-turn-helix transcriptional regulator [Ligilactobacillus apodemi]MCR1901524.1 helix-turn-helix domain-containing protein [Ligilactobacillus apodemi]
MENNITKTLITLRESRNMSQAQLANLMGLNKNVMGRIERGLRSLRADEIVRLAKIFDVSTDFI